MPFKSLKTKTMPIGVDLGTSAVKMVQMRRNNGQTELFAAAHADVPSDFRNDAGKMRGFQARCIRDLLKSHGFKGRQCTFSVPAADTFVQHVKIAKMLPKELDKALQWELEGKLPFNYKDAIIRRVIVERVQNENDSEQEVIIIAISRQSAEAYLKMAGIGKIEVVAMHVEPFAILECFTRLCRQNSSTLFLDIGCTYTQVVIAHGPKLVFARNLLFGADRIDSDVSKSLGMDVEEVKSIRRKVSDPETSAATEADRLYEAVSETLTVGVDEITKCLRYYDSIFPSRPVERAIFLGGQAKDKRLCQDIARQLNLPSQIGAPLAKIKHAENAGIGSENGPDVRDRVAQPEWAVAVGLSLGARKDLRAA